VLVQPFSSGSVQPAKTAGFAIFVWSTGAESDGVTVTVSIGKVTDVDAPHFTVCSQAKGAVCTVGDLPTGQSDELVAGVYVSDAATAGEKITLTATAKAAKATSFDAKATIDVVASSSTSSSTSTSSPTSSVGDSLGGTYLPELPDGAYTSPASAPSGLFPTVSPTSGASTPSAKAEAKAKKAANAEATTVSSTLPLDSRLIGGQLAGLVVLAAAIAVAVARLSLRTGRPHDGSGPAK
jgi:hypothetical protein